MYELLRESTCSGSSDIRQFTPTPSPQAIAYGLRGQQVKSNSCRCKKCAFSVVTPQHGKASAVRFHSNSLRRSSRSFWSQATIWVKSQTVSTSFASSIQIEYSTCRKSRFLRLQKLTIRVVGALDAGIYYLPVSNLKIVQNEGDWEPFSQKNNRSL